jgi:NAD(P)-dependent dehydrogenase (short-subunit alcohol dehydrogenase family)
MSLEGKVALVTGAGRGMGRATALALANDGADVAVTDILADAVEETSTDVRATGRNSVAIAADIGDGDDIDRVIADTVSALGRVDILVNNAGVTRYLDIMDITEADWDRIHRVNARGAFFVMQRIARQMIEQGDGGRIVNIASIAGKGYRGTSNAAYAASKGAVLAMTMIAAHQLGRHDINVNAICPGATLTAMGEETMAGRAATSGITMEELAQARDARIPIGRANEPEDIAAMARFLSGPGSRNITGQSFNVDGGLVMH